MKHLMSLCLAFLMIVGSLSCNAQDNKKADAKTAVSNKVEVYYFHFTRRCHTCQSVESNAKLAVEALYPHEIKNGTCVFKALNLDDASSKAIAEKSGVGGQTLLVVCGNKKVDITSQGFMNAQNLEKMKEEMKKAVTNVTMNQ